MALSHDLGKELEYHILKLIDSGVGDTARIIGQLKDRWGEKIVVEKLVEMFKEGYFTIQEPEGGKP